MNIYVLFYLMITHVSRLMAGQNLAEKLSNINILHFTITVISYVQVTPSSNPNLFIRSIK